MLCAQNFSIKSHFEKHEKNIHEVTSVDLSDAMVKGVIVIGLYSAVPYQAWLAMAHALMNKMFFS